MMDHVISSTTSVRACSARAVALFLLGVAVGMWL
jgi:hypothetical protein